MKRSIEELYAKASSVLDKHHDQELSDYLLGLARQLEDAETMYHQFGYLLMHVKAAIAHPARPIHLQEAIDRADRFLKGYGGESR